jgi:prophage regulatory protein
MSQTRRGLRLPQVEAKTGLKKTQIFDAVQRGIFPKPFRILPGGRAVAWDEREIDEHLDRQMAERESAASSDPAPTPKQKRHRVEAPHSQTT